MYAACRGQQTQIRLHGLRTASDIAVRFFATTRAKRKILAYFDDRSEREVLIDPRRIRFTVLEWTEEQLNEAAERFTQRVLAENKALLDSMP